MTALAIELPCAETSQKEAIDIFGVRLARPREPQEVTMCRHQIITLLALTLVLGAGPARVSHAQWRVDGAPVCTAAKDQGGPTIISDGAGGAIILWADSRSGTSGTNYDIYAQRVDAAGAPQWTADGVAICTAAGNQNRSTLVTDGAGGAIVTWRDYRSGTNWDIYAQRVDAAGAPQWTLDGVALCTASGSQIYPAIVSDGAGGAIVTWEDYRSGTSDIYAQRVDAAGAPQWAADGVALCSATGGQYNPTIDSDGGGGAIVTWSDGRSGNLNSDIYAQRVDAAGVSQWTADGVALCTALQDQLYPMIVSDGAGGAIVTWEDYRGTYADIYAQRVDAAGTPQWTADGVAMCTVARNQQYPTIASDEAGGAIVTWRDGRRMDGNNGDIYAQRVDAAGVPQWTADGVALCTACGSPTIVSDGAGGAVVTSSYGDIYAAHVLASGAVDPAWPPNGAALCTAAGTQDYTAIASDGAGGAIVAWEDNRSGTNWDIYAQRGYGAGAVAAVPPGNAPAHFQLLALAPNPARDGRLMIRFSLPATGRVSAQVLDLAGHRVRTLAREREFPPGTQVLGWDGRNEAFVPLPSGIYFVEVREGGHSETRRAVLLR